MARDVIGVMCPSVLAYRMGSARAIFVSLGDVIVDWSVPQSNGYRAMVDTTDEIYGAAFDTEEFWRVVMHIGPAISAQGFKRTYWKNRRWLVKKTADSTHNAKVRRGPATEGETK